MNNQIYPQTFHKLLNASEKFVSDSISFLHKNNHEIRYYDANIPLIHLLPTIPILSHQLKVYVLIGIYNWDHWRKINDTLDDILENLESISVNIPEGAEYLTTELGFIWGSINEVIKEIKNVLDWDYPFDFEEKMLEIKKRLKDGDYYSEEDYYNEFKRY
ncbi:hypothetical protein [Fictibacillus halophilus]|uniref:hypothetical protein n=1 Tax=Fictibacillus halophilus TaxID=1610490 RepID=UPI001CFB57C1|nr:hypothetical protein [Fictibacillus halophilus]